MTLQEMLTRLAEINKRLAAISTECRAEGATSETLEALNKETDDLINERTSLQAQIVELKTRGAAEDFKPVVTPEVVERSADDDDIYSSLEYRKAFMKWMVRGIDNPILHRGDASTQKANVGSVIIPTTITSKIFAKNDLAGSLFDRVTKTNYAPGIAVPKSSFKPTLSWVAENGKSDRLNATSGSITFNGYKGEIRVSLSLEVSVMALEAFEAGLAEKIIEACRLGFDAAIVAGTGSGQPKGVLTDGTYSGTGCNAYTLNNLTVSKHDEWVKLWAKLPEAYKMKAQLHINSVDWYGYIFGMKDSTGRVVAFETTGFGGEPIRTFMGRPVVILEDQGLNTFDSITGSATKSKTTAFAYFCFDEDYIFNSNLNLRLKKYTDEETDEEIYKATVVADGKLVDTKSLLIVCRGADAQAS